MDTQIPFQRIIESIDGNVHSKGIKIDFPAWMVIGSTEWEATPDDIKAHAYQAALAMGWSHQSLTQAVCTVYPHIDKHMAKFTLDLLAELSQSHPLALEKKRDRPKVVIVAGSHLREI